MNNDQTVADGLSILRQPGEEPTWAVKYGAEFWKTKPVENASASPAHGGRAPGRADLSKVIERVDHTFTPGPDPNEAAVKAGSYQARIASDGLHLRPAGGSAASLADPGLELRLFTSRVGDGQATLFDGGRSRPQPRVVLGNTVQTLLDPDSGLVEHFETLAGGVELAWIIPWNPQAMGPVAIDTTVVGMAGALQKDGAIHLADAGGVARWRIGAATAVDAQGRRWDLSTTVQDETLRVELPTQVLAEAVYPLAIDPVISPEIGVDQPLVSATPSLQAAPVVAASSQAILVAWAHGKGDLTPASVYAARLTLEGKLADPYGLMVAPAHEQTMVSVAANEGGFLVAWSAPKGSTTTDWDIFAARVSAQGEVKILPPVCNSSGIQNSPAVAAGTAGFYIAWRDARNAGIYGALLKNDGSLSTTNGLSLTSAASDQLFPAVAALNDQFLVVWQDYRKATSAQFNADIYGTLISSNGTLVNPAGIAICTNANTQWLPAVAANGTNYLVVWEEYSAGGNDIAGARVSPAGVVLDTNALAISTATNCQGNPSVAASQGEFLVAWQDFRRSGANMLESDILAARVEDSGRVLDPDGVLLSAAAGNQCHPAVSAVGDGWQVVWQDARNHPVTILAEIYTARIGRTSDPGVLPELPVSVSANFQATPAVAANGTNFLVVWADNRNLKNSGMDILGVRLDENALPLDAAGIPISVAPSHQTVPAVAASGRDFLVVWADQRNSPVAATNLDIYGARVSAGGQVLDPSGFPICSSTNVQNFPVVAAKGDRWLVAWQDARSSSATLVRWDIYGARVALDGAVLDTNAIPICTAANDQTLPAMAANSSLWMLVWEDRRSSANPDIYGARVDGDGRLLDTNGLAICSALQSQTLPAIAANGEDFFAAWADSRNSTTSLDIYGVFLPADGLPSASDIRIVRQAAYQQTAPSVAAYGGDYFVAWQEAVAGLTNNFNLVGVSLADNGAVLPGSLALVNTNAYDQVAPRLAVMGGHFLVVGQGLQYGGARTVANRVSLNPHLVGAQRPDPGRFQFTLVGARGGRYAIETSTNLADWVQISTLVNTNGLLEVVDSNAPPAAPRFYRAILLP